VAEDSPEHLQSRLAGAQRVSLRVQGDADGLESSLSAVNGVQTVVAQPDGTWEVETVPGIDTRPQIARATVQAGYDLLEMRAIGLSLEDIFMELTREEPEPPAMDETEAEQVEPEPEQEAVEEE